MSRIMQTAIWLTLFLFIACKDCAHFVPFQFKPMYTDMGKCALYKDRRDPKIIGYAEGARCDPTKCGREAAWFEPKKKDA